MHYTVGKPCSIVYSNVKCQRQPITRNPMALLSIPILPSSYQHKCEQKNPAFDARTPMLIDFKFTCLTTPLTNKLILCNSISNNESITIHNIPITESVVVSSKRLHIEGHHYGVYRNKCYSKNTAGQNQWQLKSSVALY